MGQSERSRDMATKVLLCALLGSAASKPVAEADLRFTRSAEAEAKAEPDAEALRPFAYSSPSGAVSFSLGGAAPSVASAAPVLASSAPFTAHQPVSAVAHQSVSPAVVASPFAAHQPVSAGLASNLVNVAATPVTHHAALIARTPPHSPRCEASGDPRQPWSNPLHPPCHPRLAHCQAGGARTHLPLWHRPPWKTIHCLQQGG